LGKLQNMVGLLLLVLAHAGDALACTKTVRWYDDAPYAFRTAGGKVEGFDVDLAREALRRAGCAMRLVEMPFARALAELEAGRLDILPSTFRSAQRERYAYFSIPTLQSPNVLYLGPGVAEKYPLARLDDMLGTGFRLGVQIGVSYGDKFDALKADPRFQANMVPVTLRRNAWKMMSLGRIDGMIADQASAELEIGQLKLSDELRAGRVVVSTSTAMFAMSKQSNSADFVATVNKALAAMVEDGQYRKIRARYLRCPPGVKVLGCK